MPIYGECDGFPLGGSYQRHEGRVLVEHRAQCTELPWQVRKQCCSLAEGASVKAY